MATHLELLLVQVQEPLGSAIHFVSSPASPPLTGALCDPTCIYIAVFGSLPFPVHLGRTGHGEKGGGTDVSVRAQTRPPPPHMARTPARPPWTARRVRKDGESAMERPPVVAKRSPCSAVRALPLRCTAARSPRLVPHPGRSALISAAEYAYVAYYSGSDSKP